MMRTKHTLLVAPLSHIDEANRVAGELATYQEPGVDTFARVAQVEDAEGEGYSLAAAYLTDAQYEAALGFVDALGGFAVVLGVWTGSAWRRDKSIADALVDLGLTRVEV